MGQTLQEFIQQKVSDPGLRDEILAEITWRGMDRDHGLIFEDSIEELDTPTRTPRVGHRVQLRRSLADKQRFIVKAVEGDQVTVVPMKRTDDKRSWVEIEGVPEQTYAADELITVVTHIEKVFPGLVSAGSVGPETDAPSHIAIRGENLHTLRALGYSHTGAVDLIYIDPPYNTGNKDWIYNDKRVDENDGFRHSKWLAFMHRRLELARELLKETGIIAVSIGHDEQHHLRMLMDDVFGEDNFVSCISRRAGAGGRQHTYVKQTLDYVLIYRLSPQAAPFVAPRSEQYLANFKNADDVGLYRTEPLYKATLQSTGRTMRYWIECPDGTLAIPPGKTFPPASADAAAVTSVDEDDKIWRWKPETFEDGKHLIVFKRTKTSPLLTPDGSQSAWNVYTKQYLDTESEGAPPLDYWDDVPNTLGTKRLIKIGVKFPYSKPVELMSRILQMTAPADAVVLDFFGGSGSTLEAVLRLNDEDGGMRQCIIATSNELGEKQEKDAAKAGHAPGDPEWEGQGVFEYVLRPRIETILTGNRPDGSTYGNALAGEHRVEFFTLDYMDDEGDLDTYIDYDMMAPLLWARAGGVGPIPKKPKPGESVIGERFAILFDVDQIATLTEALADKPKVATIFIVAGSEETYRQAASDVAGRLPRKVKTIHLERTYLDARAWIPKDRRRKAH